MISARIVCRSCASKSWSKIDKAEVRRSWRSTTIYGRPLIMALKDTFSNFFDNTGLAEVFSRPAWDAEKARKPLLKGIDAAKKQFESGQTKAPNRWWKVSNGVVALTVKVAGDTFDINGVATNHMPEERFPEFLSKFRAAVEAGEFDDELKNHGNGDATVHIAKVRKPRAASTGGGSGWSEERRAAFAKTIAARKAAKGE
jgi:hypothetical protein